MQLMWKPQIKYTADEKKLREINEYILNNLATELNVSVLSTVFGIGKSTLRRQYLLFYRRSVSEFILDSRMATAMSLLTHYPSPVNQIAALVGYSDRSAFTHAFTKYFGHSPLHYLKRSSTGNEVSTLTTK